MTRHLPAAAVLACTALLAACSGTSASASLDGPLLVSGGSWDDAMTAAIGGPVTKVGTCVGIGESMVVWPEGVSWNEDSQSLVLPDGTQVALGSEVSGGGGGMTTSAIDSLFGSEAAEGLRECGVEDGEDVVVFNVGGRLSTTPVS
ncbi:hypothetical protein GCM10027519_33770 [Kineococcus endophyticus]